MTFEFSRISKINLETSVEYLLRYFLNHSAWFFFLEQTADTQIYLVFWVMRYHAKCTGLKRLDDSAQNKICYSLHPKYTPFSCFPLICLAAFWKSLILRNGVTQFLVSWRKLTECYSKLLPTTSCTCRLFSCTFHECKALCVQKGLCDAVQPLDISFLTRSLLVKLNCASLQGVCFD